MAEIIKMYKQSLPAMKFVGRCYREEDKQNNTFSHKWGEWFANKLFEPLCMVDCGDEEPFEDSKAYYGLSLCKEGEPYEYWIGVFLPLEATVPDGYESFEVAAGDIAVSWVFGKEPDIYFACPLERMKAEGYEWTADKNGVRWCFERYVCPRFTEPDKEGNVILDMCFYVSWK